MKRWAVETIEKKFGKSLKEVLDDYESKKTPIELVAQELEVSIASVNNWRKKLGYPLRKHFKGVKNDIQSGSVL